MKLSKEARLILSKCALKMMVEQANFEELLGKLDFYLDKQEVQIRPIEISVTFPKEEE